MDPLIQILFGIITALAMVNAFFIRGLVKKLDKSAEMVHDLARDMSHMKTEIDKLSDLNERLGKMEREIAVLNYRIEKAP